MLADDVARAWLTATTTLLSTPTRAAFLVGHELGFTEDREAVELQLMVPTRLAAEMIDKHSTDLTASVAQTLGRKTRLRISVDPALTPRAASGEALIAEAAAHEMEEARAAGALAFYPVVLAQVSLPYTDPKSAEYIRTNGFLSLSIVAPSDPGLPYGTIPRLLLCWLATEVTRTSEPRLVLGHSMTEFLDKVGLNRNGGKRGDITRLRNQTERLFSSHISARYSSPGRTGLNNILIADDADFWWDPKRPDSPALWQSSVTLSDKFYRQLKSQSLPIDVVILKELRRSALAVDIYIWLTYRMSYLREATTIPRELLERQFGADFGRSWDFWHKFQIRLAEVLRLYPAGAEVTPSGLRLTPSAPSVQRRQLS